MRESLSDRVLDDFGLLYVLSLPRLSAHLFDSRFWGRGWRVLLKHIWNDLRFFKFYAENIIYSTYIRFLVTPQVKYFPSTRVHLDVSISAQHSE